MFFNVKRALEYISFLVSVPKCVCCGTRLNFSDKALCDTCRIEYEHIKTRECSRCGKVLHQCSCSNEYLKRHFVKKVIKVFRYLQRPENKRANSLIYSLKRDNRRDVLLACTDELSTAVCTSLGDISDYIITNVPRRRKTVIKYGIDHAAELAKSLAKSTGATYMSLLKSNAKKAQKTLFGKDRIINASFDVRREIDLTGKKVIIVDDIITTGASLGACAMLIRGLGSKYIVGAALAIVYRDDFIKYLSEKEIL